MKNEINLTVYEFQQQFTAFLDDLKNRVVTKSAEYSRGNAFSNFNTAAELKQTDPRLVLDWYMTKHLISYIDMIKDIENSFNPTNEYSAEKLGDLITYMGILHIMNVAENNKDQTLPF